MMDVSHAYVELAPGILRIPTMGDFVNSFVLLEEDGSVTLVDCGLKNAPARLLRALEDLGRDPRDVQRIVLTHAHNDHAGGAARMVQETSVTGVHAHSDDRAFFESGAAPAITSRAPLGRILARLQDLSFAPIAVDKELSDGQLLDCMGGLQVLHTPGHTPGHISLLHPASGVLITGDCILNPLSRMQWAYSIYCTSPEQNRQSAARFADLEFSVAAFTHGTEIRERARERVRGFLTRKGALT
jgi:glyoxylase-like metal-dependent hydrolase (beta-lactamase superfamily II)